MTEVPIIKKSVNWFDRDLMKELIVNTQYSNFQITFPKKVGNESRENFLYNKG